MRQMLAGMLLAALIAAAIAWVLLTLFQPRM
jgi:hypothetical protein